MFEKYNVPAFFLSKNAVLSAYPWEISKNENVYKIYKAKEINHKFLRPIF